MFDTLEIDHVEEEIKRLIRKGDLEGLSSEEKEDLNYYIRRKKVLLTGGIPVRLLNYDHLGRLLQCPDIAELEADLIIQTCTHILSGNRTPGKILEVYKNTGNPYYALLLDLTKRDYK